MTVVERIARSYDSVEDFSVEKTDVRELEDIHETQMVYKETLKNILSLGQEHTSPEVRRIIQQVLK